MTQQLHFSVRKNGKQKFKQILGTSIQSSIIYNSQKVEATQKSING